MLVQLEHSSDEYEALWRAQPQHRKWKAVTFIQEQIKRYADSPLPRAAHLQQKTTMQELHNHYLQIFTEIIHEWTI